MEKTIKIDRTLLSNLCLKYRNNNVLITYNLQGQLISPCSVLELLKQGNKYQREKVLSQLN
jgi:hypothetical protein